MHDSTAIVFNLPGLIVPNAVGRRGTSKQLLMWYVCKLGGNEDGQNEEIELDILRWMIESGKLNDTPRISSSSKVSTNELEERAKVPVGLSATVSDLKELGTGIGPGFGAANFALVK